MTCWTSNQQPAQVGPDDIYDFSLSGLANGTAMNAPPKTFCSRVSGSTCSTTSFPSFLVELRPVNRNIIGAGRGLILSAVTFSNPQPCTAGTCGTPELYVYSLAAGTNGASSDTLSLVNGNFFTLTGLTVATERAPDVAQTESSGLLPILVDELQTDNGNVVDNTHQCSGGTCDEYFVTSFTALAPDATISNGIYTSGDSYYVAFVLDVSRGSFVVLDGESLGDIVSYSNAVIDSERALGELHRISFLLAPLLRTSTSGITTRLAVQVF